MTEQELMNRIAELEAWMMGLPAGSIGKKTVNGKTYYYHRYQEAGKRVEKYVPAEEVDDLKAKIDERRALEKEYKQLYRQAGAAPKASVPTISFTTNVRVGEELSRFAEGARKFKKRSCFQVLSDYLRDDSGKVFVLCGLRRTGKTTLIRQALLEMSPSQLSQAAFIQIRTTDTLAAVNQDMKLLEARGYKYVFLDEVTLMEDFIGGAALFSDVFASCGMKIILSGTDSLGFLFTEKGELYDRSIMLRTTFIPYREFESILGIHGIDEYIRYGGTMSLSGEAYQEASTFATKGSTDEYVDSAIAQNIQHSLECYQDGGHFRHLEALHEKGELTSAINRVVEDVNHRFTLEVLTRDFKSHDLRSSAALLRKDRENPTDILDRIDVEAVTEQLRKMLEIRNLSEQTVPVSEVCATEIREYLALLDLIQTVDVVSLPKVADKRARTLISQPGLRYSQAEALVKTLLEDAAFQELSLSERNRVIERILNEIKGRMLEDVVLLETKLAFPKKQVMVVQFAVGEFDMLVFDPEDASCEIYEIKHSTETVDTQYWHLTDPEKCAQAEHRFGPITGKYVLYRGEDRDAGEIKYRNVEGYLNALGRLYNDRGSCSPYLG